MEYIIDHLTEIIALLTAVGIYAKSMADRRKSDAEINKLRAETSRVTAEERDAIIRAAVDVVTNLLPPLNKRIDDQDAVINELRQTVMLQEHAIERLNDLYKTLEAAFVLLVNQIRALGEEPIIDLKDLAHITHKDIVSLLKQQAGK